MKAFKIVCFIFLMVLIGSCIANTKVAIKGKNHVDTRDNKSYRIEKIGNLYWTLDNAAFDSYQSKCYNGLDSNCIKYGKIYTWEQAKSSCLVGWRLPTSKELMDLFLSFGKISYAGDDPEFERIFGVYEPEKTDVTFKKLMVSTLNLPVFNRNSIEYSGSYQQRTLFWSSDENPNDKQRVFAIYWNSEGNEGNGAVHFSDYPKAFFGFCRCVKEVTKK